MSLRLAELATAEVTRKLGTTSAHLMRRNLSPIRGVSYDLRIAARRLTSQPLLPAAMILTFGLSVALATTIYSVAYSVLLRPLPYTDPDRLLSIWRTTPDVDFVPLPVPELFDLRLRATALEGVAGFAPAGFSVRVADRTVWADAFEVTANWFAVLGVGPVLGRTFQDGEDAAGRDKVIVITEHFWRTELGADPRIIGAQLQLADTGRSGSPFQVIGVVRDDMEFSYPTKLRPAAYVPRGLTPGDVADPARMVPELIAIGRVRRGVELRGAVEQVRTVLSESVRQHPTMSIPKAATRAISLHEEMVGRTRPVFLLLTTAAALLLAVAATNVGAVTLGMASARRGELAIRIALGSTIIRLIRALLIEHALLAVASGAVAIVIAAWTIPVVRAIAPVLLPRVNEIRFEGTSMWFAMTVALGGSLAFAVAPVLALVKYASSARLSLRDEIAAAGRRHRLAMLMTVAQAALVIALLASAAAIGRGLWRLAHIDLGFEPRQVLVAELTFAGNANPKLLEHQIMDAVRAVPGVTEVSTASDLPFSFGVLLPVESPKLDRASRAVISAVSGDYFELMRMKLTRGSTLATTERGNRAVVVVNESLARAAGITGAGGERIKIAGQWREVVGIVRDITELGTVRAGVIRQPGFTRLTLPTAYIPGGSEGAERTFLLARTSLSPTGVEPLVRRALFGVGPSVVIRRIGPLDQRVATPAMDARFAATVMGGYGVVALLIASLGLYGLLTHVVRQRTREVAIRMALGATTRDLLRSTIGTVLGCVVAGLALGLGSTVTTGRYLGPWLFETSAVDAVATVGAATVLLAIAAIAALAPVLHLSRIDPASALRAD
jgi:predicted permease